MHCFFALPGWRHACNLEKEGVNHLRLDFGEKMNNNSVDEKDNKRKD